MQEYRAYVIGQDGHFRSLPVDLVCADEQAAKEKNPSKLFRERPRR